MDGQQREDARDDLQAEVSEIGEPGHALSSLEPRMTRRRALRLAGIVGALLLALLVILGSVPSLRDRAVALAFPTPTPALAPGADLFYLPVNPQGTVVLLDGRPLAHVPVPGDPQPLRLARGRHRLEWRGGAFPFLPRQCVVSVPRADTDTCPFISTGLSSPRTSAPIIGLQVSLLALPSGQRAALLGVTQAALDASGSSAIVQPGEHYFSPASEFSPSLPAPIRAAQPLRAMLDLQLNPQTEEAPEPCFIDLVQPCWFPGQRCQDFCTLASDSLPGTSLTPVWIAAAMVQSSWTFTTLDGKVVASNQQEFPTNIFFIVLRITWDGAHWHVAPLIGHTPGLPITDDLMCGPVRDWIAAGSVDFEFTPPSGAAFAYVSGPIPTDGCALVITGYAGAPPTFLPPPALYLERFGVLLAANDAAHSLWRDLPRAEASEQALAQRLAAQLSA